MNLRPTGIAAASSKQVARLKPCDIQGIIAMRIKKMLLCFLMLLMISALCGCIKKEAEENRAKGNQNIGKETRQDYSYRIGDKSVYVGQTAAEALQLLGGEYETYEAPSCAAEGTDVFYYYQNLTLVVLNTEKEKIVSQLYFKNDSVATAEGLRIGDPYAKVIDTYGEDYLIEGTALNYQGNKMQLVIGIKDQKVDSVTYKSK